MKEGTPLIPGEVTYVTRLCRVVPDSGDITRIRIKKEGHFRLVHVVFFESINRDQDIDLLNVVPATLMGRTLNLLRYLRRMACNA
jgi:hypothetical protein